MTGLSDGEIPVTPLESMYTYSAMLIGLFMFGTIIGNVNAIVENMERKRDEFMNNTSKVFI